LQGSVGFPGSAVSEILAALRIAAIKHQPHSQPFLEDNSMTAWPVISRFNHNLYRPREKRATNPIIQKALPVDLFPEPSWPSQVGGVVANEEQDNREREKRELQLQLSQWEGEGGALSPYDD
jgi:hypothetical protein